MQTDFSTMLLSNDELVEAIDAQPHPKVEKVYFLAMVRCHGIGMLHQRLDPDVLPLPGEQSRRGDGARRLREKAACGGPKPVIGDAVAPLRSPIDVKRAAAKAIAYIDESGRFIMPAANIQTMLATGDEAFYGKVMGQMLCSGLTVETPMVLVHPKTRQDLKWRDNIGEHGITSSPDGVYLLCIPASGTDGKGNPRGRVNTSRVFITEWCGQFIVSHDRKVITKSGDAGVKAGLRDALMTKGLGGWRPGAPKRPGRFGMGELTGYRELDA